MNTSELNTCAIGRNQRRHQSHPVAPSVAISADAKDHQQINGDQGGQRGGNHHLLVPPLPPSLRQSVAISGNQWQSVAISGNQWQSVAIITCWSHPDACESEYATRRSSSIAFSVGRKNAQPTLSVKCCTLQPARGGGCAVMSTCMQGSSSVAINVPVHTARPRPNPCWRHGWIGFDLPSAAISGGSPDASIRIQM